MARSAVERPLAPSLTSSRLLLTVARTESLGAGRTEIWAQAVAEHDLAQLGQGGQALGQQAEQALIIALLKRQTALVEITEVQSRCIHNAKPATRRGAARRALFFKGCPERPG